MSEKHSIASKKRWANVSPEQRTKIAKKLAANRWKGVPLSKRREHSLLMVKARDKK